MPPISSSNGGFSPAAPEPGSEAITSLLQQTAAGDRQAEARLVAAIYGELRALARRELLRWPASTTPATALAHELFERLLRSEREWPNRRYFFGACARALHEILIEQARRRRREERLPTSLPAPGEPFLEDEMDELRVNLDRLDVIQARAAEVFRLHFLVGKTIPEIAAVLACGHATVERDLLFARTWLHERMRQPMAP